MKNIAILVIVILITAGCSGNTFVKKVEPGHVIHLSEYQKLDGMKGFYSYLTYCYTDKKSRVLPKLDGVESLSAYVGYLDKGDIFPLSISFENDVVGTNLKTIDMVVKQKIYFMVKLPNSLSSEGLAKLDQLNTELISKVVSESDIMQGFTVFVSKDAENWAYAWDWKGLKKAFGIGGGSFSYGVGINHDEGLTANLGIKLVSDK
jgi:hypothetical protein